MWDLAAIGYDVGVPDVVLAFQRHFLAGHLSGVADDATVGRVAALRKLLKA
jgi:N-acetyl-anhydromuramyl-L-alanine amidase AmpD